DHIRNRHTRRDMLEREFEAIWDAQQKFHPTLLTPELRYGSLGKGRYPCVPRPRPNGKTELDAFGIHGMIFFHRKLYWPASVVGLCELESKQKRSRRADRHSQRFRLLQEVNNLRIVHGRTERPLNELERTLLLDKLGQRREMTFDAMRQALGKLPDS